MNTEYLSIKQVSEITNTSYQNIYQRAKTTLKQYVVVIDGRKMFNKEVLREFNISDNAEEIKEEFKDEIKSSLNNNTIPLHNDIEEELREEINELRARLQEKEEIIKSKDEQLSEQTKQLFELSQRVVKLYENSQSLQLQTQLLLSEKSFDPMDAQQLRASDEINEDIKPKRKGLLSRFFK